MITQFAKPFEAVVEAGSEIENEAEIEIEMSLYDFIF